MIKFCKTALKKAPWNPFDVCNFCKNTKCKWKNKDDNPKYIGEHYISIDDENEEAIQ